ncbi:hypothetical protein DF185_06405 [Marinifilum breve]|uniref:Uncharacterized protein n=1 Tax=Marinifilum breve TaxID=2184082 RepID=A0A2V4A068_9BACT|nr:DUF6331 family protein [Marinifilum breve]PXY02275.1 hypothetical protein DF185_06405 [Marinifilum breve]
MSGSKDISIGNDIWIEWIEFDSESVKPKDIDSLLDPTKIFWKHIEVECVAECCGIDAFSFLGEDIIKACKKVGIPNIVVLFDQMIREIELLDDEVLISGLLNQLISRKVFLDLLQHIVMQIRKV